jgi:2,5-diamino-6-(ribosylamino)-4(3H)-pyrimidinone 5'-phosphate reductase
MTLDGKIATASGDSRISSNEDRARVHKLRAKSDAIVVGISTILADDPLLTVRFAKGKNPTRVVVDSQARIPLNSKIIRTGDDVRTIIAVTRNAPKENIQKLRDSGAEVLVTGEGSGFSAAVPHGVNLKELFDKLHKLGFKSVLVEGGGELNWSLMQLGLVDQVIVTIAPRVVGGRLATTLFEGDGVSRISEGISLKLTRAQRKKTGELVLYYQT